MRARMTALFGLACAACGFILGNDEDPASGNQDPAGTDGGSSGADVINADGGGSGNGFCDLLVPKPTFCDDFERNDLLGPWSGTAQMGGGAMAIVSGTRGRELSATLPSDGAAGARAALDRDLGHVSEKVELAYRIRVAGPPSTNSIDLMHLRFVNDSGAVVTLFFRVQAQAPQTQYLEFGDPRDGGGLDVGFLTNVPVPFGDWHDVHVVLDIPSPPHLLLQIDGKTAYDVAAIKSFAPGNLTLTAGIGNVTDTMCPCGPLDVRIDEVVATVK